MSAHSASFAAVREDAAAILSLVWERLVAAPDQLDAPWRLGVFGSVDDHEHCALRTVVLRHVAPALRQLVFHTDRRSPKLDQLARRPQGAWLFYDPIERVQLRITGPTMIDTEGPFADARWQATSLEGRRMYLAPVAPGTPQPGPFVNLPDSVRHRMPILAESEAGRGHFAAVTTTVETLDWYDLHPSGHLRVSYTWPQGRPAWTWRAS
jgi:pyridoxamine 5'-phosphate oxidase